MSAKWVRSQRWDDRHLTGALWPVKVVLRLFSWISTAIVLLSLVAMYGILASVPVGLIAKIPTVLVDGLSFVLVVGVIGIVPVWVAIRVMRSMGVGRIARVVTGILGVVVLCVVGAFVWWYGVWPALRYDPVTGSGLRFFGAFIDRYQAVQVRRLPGMEMSELEFYAWWPLRVVLLLFVVNLVTATIRRIEFTFPRIGVLTVHSGIITIALGSIYYTTHKQEGDMILLSGENIDDAGNPSAGRPESGFYDNIRVALWATRDPKTGWEERQIRHVPRYNDYNLDVLPRAEGAGGDSVASFPALDLPIPDGAPGTPERPSLLDSDVHFRIVGYASYCELVPGWAAADKLGAGAGVGQPTRLRTLELALSQTLPDGTRPRHVWELAPDRPADRIDTSLINVEYTIGMSDSRWEALSAPLPPGSDQALLVEHPASGFKAVYAVQPEKSIVVGETGYTLMVRSIMARPPMPIVTKGYQGADSSLAIVRVNPPADSTGAKPASYDRWVYSRFPEISQDMVGGTADGTQGAMPKRRDADPALRITYIDGSRLQVYFDERPDGSVRAIVRTPGAAPVVTEHLKQGDQVAIAPVAGIKLGERIERAVRVETPRMVPESEREKDKIGKHEESAIALQVRDKSGAASVHWVPFSQYCDVESHPRQIALADGRVVHVMFGRQRHEFWPPMTVRLKDFEMTPYPNSTTPKDYRSEVVVTPRWGDEASGSGAPKSEVRATSLNNPLLIATPYMAPPGMPSLGRLLGRAMSVIAPNQYKFAQAGWDQAGWRQSEGMVASGELKRPVARFTILGVGNNPGIYIIATGAVMMSVGIPWAFYLKPWLMKREKHKIQARLARGEAVHSNGKVEGTQARRPERVATNT